MSTSTSLTPADWKLSVPEQTVHGTCESYPEAVAETILWLYDHYREQRITLRALGQAIGLDGSNISKIWRGPDLYQGNLEAVAQRIERYRAEFYLNNGIGQPDFIRTDYASLIYGACERVDSVGEIGRIIGNYGDGKTVALREYAALRPREVFYHECGESGAFYVNMRDVAGTLGISTSNPAILRDRIIDAFRRRKTRLIIIDDLHAIFNWLHAKSAPGPGQFCDFLRKIHDRLDISVMICGTDVLPDRLQKGPYRKALEQLIDRGDTVLDLTKWRHPLHDLESFYQYYSLPPRPTKAAQKIIDHTLEVSSLRKLVFKLRAGARSAKKMGQRYTWAHFVDAQNLNAHLANDPLTLLDS